MRLPLVACALALVAVPVTASRALPDPGGPLKTTLVARTLQPGEVIRVDVRSDETLDSVTLTAFGQRVTARREQDDTWRAIVGIDLDVTPGPYVIAVEAVTGSGSRVQRDEPLTVIAKAFPTRELTVDPKFVTPPPSVQPRIAREAARLGALFARVGPVAWRDPFELPIAGTMVSGFGVRSVFNGEPRAPHGGADFAATTGTPVLAPNAGTVVLDAPLYFTGRTIVVDHGGGIVSLFAHLSRSNVTAGARVTRGQRLGAVGQTGRVTGPHLHWTVRIRGARVDPLSLVYATSSGS